ncbi:hypothetical protein DDT52_00405 [Brenneria roseae subsp. roseae]|nr:hypothetical protein DDT52_00405 [Brenneria roseae subsp. roseae]
MCVISHPLEFTRSITWLIASYRALTIIICQGTETGAPPPFILQCYGNGAPVLSVQRLYFMAQLARYRLVV